MINPNLIAQAGQVAAQPEAPTQGVGGFQAAANVAAQGVTNFVDGLVRKDPRDYPRQYRLTALASIHKERSRLQVDEIETDLMAQEVIAAKQRADAALSRVNALSGQMGELPPEMPTQPSMSTGEAVAAGLVGLVGGDPAGAVNTGQAIAGQRQANEFQNDMARYEAQQRQRAREMELALGELGYERGQIDMFREMFQRAEMFNVQTGNQARMFDLDREDRLDQRALDTMFNLTGLEMQADDSQFSRTMAMQNHLLQKRGLNLEEIRTKYQIMDGDRNFEYQMARYEWEKQVADRQMKQDDRRIDLAERGVALNEREFEHRVRIDNLVQRGKQFEMFGGVIPDAAQGVFDWARDQQAAALESELKEFKTEETRLSAEVASLRASVEAAGGPMVAGSMATKLAEAQAKLAATTALRKEAERQLAENRAGSNTAQGGEVRPVSPFGNPTFKLDLPGGGSMEFED